MMHFIFYISALIVPLATTSAASGVDGELRTLPERQTVLVKPSPCVRDNSTTDLQTKTRFKAFAQAFVYEQDITEAFKYIVSDYIVRHLPSD